MHRDAQLDCPPTSENQFGCIELWAGNELAHRHVELVGLAGDVLAPSRALLPRARLGPMIVFSLASGALFAFLAGCDNNPPSLNPDGSVADGGVLATSGHPELSPRTLAFWRAALHAEDELWRAPPAFRRRSSAYWVS